MIIITAEKQATICWQQHNRRDKSFVFRRTAFKTTAVLNIQQIYLCPQWLGFVSCSISDNLQWFEVRIKLSGNVLFVFRTVFHILELTFENVLFIEYCFFFLVVSLDTRFHLHEVHIPSACVSVLFKLLPSGTLITLWMYCNSHKCVWKYLFIVV